MKTLLRILGMIVGMFAVFGFGICGLGYLTTAVVYREKDSLLLFGAGLLVLGIAFFIARALIRSLDKPDPPSQ